MQINPSIFREYDIRGVFPKDINTDTARAVGKGFALFLNQRFKTSHPSVLLGRDLRASSEPLRRGFIDGFIQNGGDVLDMGIATTPQLIYTVAAHKKAHGGAMITASHNPAEYNGFKLYARGGIEIGLKNGLLRIRKIAQNESLNKNLRVGDVVDAKHDAERYVKQLLRLIPEIQPLRVLVDIGGGAVGGILPELLSRYKLFYKPLHFSPDPYFSDRSPNPLDEGVSRSMKKEMANGRFNLGVAFDGDGDRVVFFDECGNRITNDRIFAILAAGVLDKKPKSKFVFELTHEMFLPHFISAHGGTFKESKVGGVFVRKAMAKLGAELGGETSGHIYHRELFNVDSAIHTMLRVLCLLGESGRRISDMLADLPRSTLGQFAVRGVPYIEAARRLESKFRSCISSKLDGVTVQFPGWWFNIRASNTESVLRVTIETRSPEELERRFREINRAIKI